MEKGTIARLMDKGYGFIKTASSDKDLFFHTSELQGVDFNTLSEGDAVEFEITDGEKGPQAVKVSRGDDAGASSDDTTSDEPATEEAEA